MKSRYRALRALLALTLSLCSGVATAKELHWRALEVDARLESDGTLSVSEIQRMVFTGEWNGGERKFRLGSGQRLIFDRIVRLDPGSASGRELREGNLDAVDEYAWASGNTLRWRSRLPSDPEFSNTEIAYRLDYRITGVLRRLATEKYELDHQFAFTERDGEIEHLVVHLSLAPEWRPLGDLASTWEAGPIAPGDGFVVHAELRYAGGSPPANAAPPQLPTWFWVAVAGIYILGARLFLWRTHERDRALGRFDRLAVGPVDASWLEEHVLSLPPEVVGAMWDRNVGSAEVAATLARLTQEGKLRTEVTVSGRIFKSENLHLELLVDRNTLSDYETKLVDGLFGASQVTDTESIRKRYRSTGFDPASKIRAGLESRLKRVGGFAEGSPKPAWRPTGILLLAGFLLVAGTLTAASSGLFKSLPPGNAGPSIALIFALVLVSIPGWIGAFVGQGRVTGLFGPHVALFLSELATAALLILFAFIPAMSAGLLLGGLCVALAIARSQANVLATRESAESLVRRRELLAARDHFERELAKERPALEDRWFPYLLAFGLAPKMDRWFRRFGGTLQRSGATYTSMSGGSGSSSGGGWSGGGGAFGGGGASATWAMAATAMSSGVAAPSSSGSGGGSSSGGSSGGGGGGGW